MEELSQRRDETKTRRSKPRRTILNKSYSESPTKSPKVKKEKNPGKKKKKKKDELQLFATKYQAILAEKVVGGKIQFLINWADDSETAYAPTWEPEENVTESGKLQWAEQKQDGLVVRSGGQLVLKYPEDANQQRPRRRRGSSQLSQGQGPSKKQRIVRESEIAPSQSAFQESSGVEEPREIPDTYEDDLSLLSTQPRGSIQVRVGVPAGFDRAQYQLVQTSSQSLRDSSKEVETPQYSRGEHLLQDSISQEGTQYSSPSVNRRLFVPAQSQFVIPDSQDQVDSGSYEPSTNPVRTQEAATQKSTEQDSNLVEDSQLVPSNADSINTQEVEEPLNDIDFSYQSTSSALKEGISLASSSLSQKSHLSPLWAVPESTQSANKSHPNSQVLSTKSSQLLTPDNEPDYSQDGHALTNLSQPIQSAADSFRDPHQARIIDTSSQHLPPNVEVISNSLEKHVSLNNEIQSSSLGQQIVNNSLLPPVVTHLDYSLRPSQDSRDQISPSDKQATQRSWSENTWNAAKAVPSLPRHQSASFSVVVPNSQHQTFVQFSAPTQPPVQAHLLASEIQNETLPYPESVPSTPESSNRILQSIEVDEEDTPIRTRKRKYSYSSPANMDQDAVAKRAAIRAARRDNHRKTVAASITAATLSPPSLPVLSQILPIQEEAKEQVTAAAKEKPIEDVEIEDVEIEDRVIGTANRDPIDDIEIEDDAIRAPIEDLVDDPIEDFEVEEFAVRKSVIEEVQYHSQDYLSAGYPFDEDSEVTPERTKDMRLSVQPNSENEFFLPLPLNAIARDVYQKMQGKTRDLRNEFTDSEVLESQTVREIDEVLSAFDFLCSHPDLITTDSTQGMGTDGARAKWAENVSSKCIFVAELLHWMKELDKHIVILVRPGRMLEILEAVLIHRKFSLQPQSRIDYRFSGASSGSLRVSLIPTDSSEQPCASPDLMIAFDSTFTEEPHLRKLRFNAETETLCPLVYLLVVFSIEHISKAVPRDIDHVERKVKMCNILSQYVQGVGKLDEGYPYPNRAAEEISQFIAEGALERWPCRSMPYIDDADAGTQTDTESTRQSMSYTTPMPGTILQQGLKRQLEGEDDIMDTETPKRQRITPLPDERKFHNSSLPILSSSAKSLPAQENGPFGDIADIRDELRKMKESEAQLRGLNESLSRQVNDLRSSVAEIQPKYQEALNDRGQFGHEAKAAAARASKLKENLDFKNEEVVKIKEQKQALEAELATARTALASSSIPGVAESENLKAEIRTLKQDKERLEKNKLSTGKELDFVRAQYQTASNAASESSKALLALQYDLEIQREKAKETRIEIHKIQRDSDVQNLSRMNKQMRIERNELERELEKRTNELAAAMSGRRSARGVSAPMLSPRLGGSPANGFSRGAVHRVRDSLGGGSRGGSRGSSPVGGEYPRGFTPVPSSTSSSRFQPSGPFGDALPSHTTSSGNKVEGGSRMKDVYRPT